MNTTTALVTISPTKSALVVVDMQNFFLSEALGRKRGAGHTACENLVKYAIPAARKAGMRIVWLNWGLNEEDVEVMPPAVKRAFGFLSIPAQEEFEKDFTAGLHSMTVDKFGEENVGYKMLVLGANGGKVESKNGQKVEVGRLLMRDTWNAALYPPLDSKYEEGKRIEGKPDVWIHKNRMSGMWGASTPMQEYLVKSGIQTLLFAGVNTDQCVGGTLTDAFSNGYDCILLSDGCGTTSPNFAQQCYEYNAAKTFGFCTSCKEFAHGVENMTE